MLTLDVWDILVTEQPSSEDWYIAIQSGACPDLKGKGYDHGIICPFEYCVWDSVNAQPIVYVQVSEKFQGIL
jgi:hypothetical protein